MGFYAQEHMKYDNRWVLTASGRYDKFKQTSGNRLAGALATSSDDGAFTGRIGIVRLFDNGWAPYVSYAESFEPASGQDFNGRVFKPTEGKQIESGIRYQPENGRLSLTASVYRLTQTNVSTTDPDHPGFSIQEGEVRSKGFELEARANLSNRLNLIAAYGYIDNAVTKSNSGTTGRRYPGVPRNMASLWLDYAPNGAFNIGGGVRYYDSTVNLANTVDVPGYTVFDAVASYRLAPGWVLSANIGNLFDKRYVTCTYACFYGEPRKITLTAKYQF